jgi:hypothetical protein
VPVSNPREEGKQTMSVEGGVSSGGFRGCASDRGQWPGHSAKAREANPSTEPLCPPQTSVLQLAGVAEPLDTFMDSAQSEHRKAGSTLVPGAQGRMPAWHPTLQPFLSNPTLPQGGRAASWRFGCPGGLWGSAKDLTSQWKHK